MNPLRQAQEVYTGEDVDFAGMQPITWDQVGLLAVLTLTFALVIGAFVELIKKLVDNWRKDRPDRPEWARKTLPLWPLVIGCISGPIAFVGVLWLAGIVLPTGGLEVLPAIGVLYGGATGTFAGQVYKAWDSAKGTEKVVDKALKVVDSVKAKEDE